MRGYLLSSVIHTSLNADGADETMYLAPLDRAVASGQAPADELLAKWHGEWKGSFAALFRDCAY